MKGEQLELKFPVQVFKPEEMGRVVGRTIFLSEKFLKENLGEKSVFNFSLEFLSTEQKIRDVQCPFCEIGQLKLVEVESIYERGIEGRMTKIPSAKKEQVGNRYKYTCTNCDGRFEGEIRWA